MCILDDFESIKAELTDMRTSNDDAMTALKAAKEEVLSLKQKKEKSLKDINSLLDPSKNELTKRTIDQMGSKLEFISKSRAEAEALDKLVKARRLFMESRVEVDDSDDSMSFDTTYIQDSVDAYMQRFDLKICAHMLDAVVIKYANSTQAINGRLGSVTINSNRIMELFSMGDPDDGRFLSWVENTSLSLIEIKKWVVDNIFSGNNTFRLMTPEHKIAAMLYAFVQEVRKNKAKDGSYLSCLNDLVSNPNKVRKLSESFRGALQSLSNNCSEALRQYNGLNDSLCRDANRRRDAIKSSLAPMAVSQVEYNPRDYNMPREGETIGDFFDRAKMARAQAAVPQADITQRSQKARLDKFMKELDSPGELISERAIGYHTKLKKVIGGYTAAVESTGVTGSAAEDSEADKSSLEALLRADGFLDSGSKAPVACLAPIDSPRTGRFSEIQEGHLVNSMRVDNIKELQESLSSFNFSHGQDSVTAMAEDKKVKLASSVRGSLDVIARGVTDRTVSDLDGEVQAYAADLGARSEEHNDAQSKYGAAVLDKQHCERKLELSTTAYNVKCAELKTAAEKIKDEHLTTLVYRLGSDDFTSTMKDIDDCIKEYRKARASWFFSSVRWYHTITGSDNWLYSHNQSSSMRKLEEDIELVKKVNNAEDLEAKKLLIDDGASLSFMDTPQRASTGGATGAEAMLLVLNATAVSDSKVGRNSAATTVNASRGIMSGLATLMLAVVLSARAYIVGEPKEQQNWIKKMLDSGKTSTIRSTSNTAIRTNNCGALFKKRAERTRKISEDLKKFSPLVVGGG